MSISSTQSSYHTDKAPSISNANQASSQEKVRAIAFDVLCGNKDGSSRSGSADQVRLELKQVPNSPSYKITKLEDKSISIKLNGKQYRISVHQQKHHFSYTKDDWLKIANKVKELIILSNPQNNFLKGTLKLSDRKWTPTFRDKTSQSKIEETTLHSVIKGIKQLFEHEIRPLNPLPSPKKLDTSLISSSSLLPDDSLSSRSSPDTQMGSSRKRSSEKESLDQASLLKRRKNSFHTRAEEESKQTTTEPLSEEKQESIFKKVQGLAHGIKNRVFPQKAPDTLSHLDLDSDTSSLAEEEQFAGTLTEFEYSSDTTSSMEGSLASEDIGASRTVLKDTQGFKL